MSRIAIHKGGSGMTVVLRSRRLNIEFTGMIIWPNSRLNIYIFSNEAILRGLTPLGSDWLKYGYIYSYNLTYGSESTDIHTFDLMNHVPADLEFVRFGSAVESSRMGEEALKMDLNSLRKGEALECEITNSSGVILRGKLFRSETGALYVLHNESRANGTTPRDKNWKQVSGYAYSWHILEGDLKSDCKPETYKFIRPATLLYHYDEVKDCSLVARDIINHAINIVDRGHNMGARVRVRVSGGGVIDGILIKQGKYYYILHDNPSYQGEQPHNRLYSKDGYRVPFSWWLDENLFKSTQIVQSSFHLVHTVPTPMTEVDPMNPIAKNVVGGGVVEPSRSEEAIKADVFASMTKITDVIPRSEPELILFKKSTAKVTRCDVQPMQSPQIITKNKK